MFYSKYQKKSPATPGSPSTIQTQQTQGLIAKARSNLALTVSSLATMALFLLLFGLILTAPKKKAPSYAEKVCDTPGCLLYAYYLKLSMDKHADPCHDFYEYVCGNWRPTDRDYTSVGEATFERVMSGIRSKAKKHPPAAGTRATKKAANLYQACASASDPAVSTANADALGNFMATIGLLWPNPPDLAMDPLDVLMALAGKWRTEFVFRASLHPSREALIVMFYPGKHLNYWTEMKVPREEFSHYVGLHAKLLSKSAVNKSTVERVLNAERQVVQSMVPLREPLKGKAPGVAFPIRFVGNYSRVDSSLWVSVLNENMHRSSEGEREVDEDDIFVVTDIRLFHAVDRLLAIDRGLLLDYIGWKLVERFGVFVSAVVADIRHFTSREIGIYCSALVEEVYGYALVAPFTMDSYTKEARDLAEKFLNNISKAAVESLAGTPWTEDSRLIARRKLQALSWWLWVRGKTGYISTLDQLYNSFPSTTGNFTWSWIVANTALWYKSNTPDYLQYDVTTYPSQARYLHYANAAKMPSTFIFYPMFVVGQTLAVNYAGLGAEFSRLMSQAFDSVGIMFDNENYYNPWMSDASLSAYTRKLACYEDFAHTPSMWAAVGLEIARGVYQKARHDETDNPQILINFTQYSTDQLFYIAYCFVGCSLTGYDAYSVRNKMDCNYAMQQSAHFASVFRCPVGSKMNPETKCSFWS